MRVNGRGLVPVQHDPSFIRGQPELKKEPRSIPWPSADCILSAICLSGTLGPRQIASPQQSVGVVGHLLSNLPAPVGGLEWH
jgi:hypothetical protein